MSTIQSASSSLTEIIDDTAYRNLDKRGTQEPIPQNLELYLSEVQCESLDHLMAFGWHLAFVRRPLFMPPTVVLLSPEEKQYATLDSDGSLNLDPDLSFRDLH